jgi:hypothetical protein
MAATAIGTLRFVRLCDASFDMEVLMKRFHSVKGTTSLNS